MSYQPPNSEDVVSISCSVVGVGPGGTTSMVARVAICDYRGQTILDLYVAPTMHVTDYRASITGIQPNQLASPPAYPFDQVQRIVANAIKNKVLVGHALYNDLSVLGIPHPAVNTRDVGLYQPFRNALHSPNALVGLQTLTWKLMRRRCQDGQQNPLENARAALDLYRSHSGEWENAISNARWPCALPPSTFSRCYL
ncbi:ribonuclease H-like domain-containing protein [Vararia minispora EC-137]|uniref:Ribonuclease H-like domain-containing protein n=1 Tax=Vararia minispora EC-137 TaxID=1314806 RepID=A0ACB8QNR6_9AGAM|nr:ribonuclease H-like domain-containing protein [Vararia minispora EC-137]